MMINSSDNNDDLNKNGGDMVMMVKILMILARIVTIMVAMEAII